MTLHDEILEQPKILENLVTSQWEKIREFSEETRKRNINYIFLSARGTSDNAGRYAQYLWGMHNRIPVALAAPSLFSIYQEIYASSSESARSVLNLPLLQLLGYYHSLSKGQNPDQPTNLSSVICL